MSDYQARKARALELQREKEEELKRELAAKAAREKQQARDEEERRKRLEAAYKQARSLELMRANEDLTRKKDQNEAAGMEYDPFAEDARPVAGPSVSRTPNKTGSTQAKSSTARPTAGLSNISGAGASRPRAVAGSSSGLHTKSERDKAKDQSPPLLSRKEKAARAFAAQAKKSAGDSLFSVRALVESRGSTSPAPPRSKAVAGVGSGSGSGNVGGGRGGLSETGLPIRPIATGTNGHAGGQGTFGYAKPPLKRGGSSSTSSSNPSGRLSARDQAKLASSGVNELRKLCPDRNTRDRRSIDDIARDIKAKKGIVAVTGGAVKRVASPTKGRDGGGVGVGAADGAGQKDSMGSALGRPALPLKRDGDRRPPSAIPAGASPRKQRRPSPSPSPSTSATSSSSSSPPPPRKRPRSPPMRLHENSSQAAVSAQIQALFRRPGQVQKRYIDEFSDGEEDMEAGLSDVEMEERRAAKIARREDEQAEREERERKARKEALKKGRK